MIWLVAATAMGTDSLLCAGDRNFRPRHAQVVERRGDDRFAEEYQLPRRHDQTAVKVVRRLPKAWTSGSDLLTKAHAVGTGAAGCERCRRAGKLHGRSRTVTEQRILGGGRCK